MCSVVGYIGNSQSCSVIMEGLSRLEYRGYDSAGFACVEKSTRQLLCKKTSGKLSSLVRLLESDPIDGMVGIGHTRWATHGVPSSENAHPHFDCFQKISIVHNGIIENYHDLKLELQAQGHQFRSETDTEVVAHLFEQTLAVYEGSYEKAILEVTRRLKGAYAFIIIMQEHPDVLIAVRKGSPLCLGIGKDETLIASDILAFAGRVATVAFLPDETIAFVEKNAIKIINFHGTQIDLSIQPLDNLWKVTDKGDHEHYML